MSSSSPEQKHSSPEQEHSSPEPEHSSSESEHFSSESEHFSSESEHSSSESELLSDQPPAKKPKTMSMTVDLNKDEDILQIRVKTTSGLRLANQVFQNPKFANKNAVISPLSIHIALSMVAAGASGIVKDQIVSFLGANSEEQLHSFAKKIMHVVFADGGASGGPRLSAANAVWLRDSRKFKSSFEQAMETDYMAVTRLLDFTKVNESVREVNEWAEKETNGLIKGIVDSSSFDTETVLVLANALYFKGCWSWHDTFSRKQTKPHTFHLIDGTSSVLVPFMCKSKVKASIGIYDTFKVLNLNYRTGEDEMQKRSFSMSIFLPNDITGLPSLIQRLFSTDEKGKSVLYNHISTKQVHVGNLRIPKFKIEVEFEAMDVLEQLGLKMGVLTNMVEEMKDELPGAFVSSILQKTFVEVNEKGTEAAAVNRKLLPTTCARWTKPPVYVDFIADHPFMFVIQEDYSGLVLFAGQVLDPTME